MSQKDYELFIYNHIRDLYKVKQEIEKLQSGLSKKMLLDTIRLLENEFRARFGNNKKLDYLLSLKK